MKIHLSNKTQTLNRVIAIAAVLCTTPVFSRKLRGDLVKSMDGVTDLVQNLEQGFKYKPVQKQGQISLKLHNRTPAANKSAMLPKGQNLTTQRSSNSKSPSLQNTPSMGDSLLAALDADGASVGGLLTADEAQKMLERSVDTSVNLRGNGTAGSTKACDPAFCSAIKQAKCDAKCALERRSKRRKEHVNFTAVGRQFENKGSLHADGLVWDIWEGMYKKKLDYIENCFGYATGKNNELPSQHAEIKHADGSVSYKVQPGEERLGLCYAIYYIGTVEEETAQTCSDFKQLRQTMCPECCDQTDDKTGCSGGCKLQDHHD